MSKIQSFTLLGRAGKIGLVTLAAVLITGAFLASRAHAQGTRPVRSTLFAPIDLVQAGRSTGNGDQLQIQLLLPAVDRTARGFEIRLTAESGEVISATIPPDPIRSISTFDVYQEPVGDGRTVLVHLRNHETGAEAAPKLIDPCFFIDILPAVQKSGVTSSPVASSITVSGHRNFTLDGGTQLSIPFQYALQPAPCSLLN